MDECEVKLFNASLLEWMKNFADRGVFTTDEKLTICTWNRWMELYSGYSANEIIGRKLLEVYPELSLRRLDQYYRDALSGQSRTLSQSFHGYLLPLRPIVTQLGFDLMRQKAQVMPLIAEERIVGTITLLDDVSERVATERELRQQITELERLSQALHASELWLQITLRSIGDAVIATDAQGHVTFINPVAMALTGWTQEEARGKLLAEVFKIINEETRETVESPVTQVLREGIIVGLANHTILLARDGREIPIEDSGAPIRNEAGEIAGVVLVFRDVTERRRAEAEREKLLHSEQSARAKAEEASRLKDEFLATVSHELRTPLNAMLGWTRMLRAGTLNEKDATRAVETIERNARTQNQLIEDLLDVSRIITGKLRLDLRPVELQLMIQAALDTMRPASEAKGIKLASAIDDSVGPILGDADRLQQIVWNLLANAIKFTPSGGRVEVRLHRVGNEAQVSITDTGQGISAEFLPFVFDRFRQANGKLTRAHGGLGLGLAIVRHLVELHGGSVMAESRGEGLGASFKLNFPLIGFFSPDAVSLNIPAPAPEEELQLPLNTELLAGVRVLLVDDEIDQLLLCQVLLEQAGGEVRTASSVASALKTLEDWQPDVLVSDISMPGEDGYDLIRQVRAQGHRLPAIALTALSKSTDRLHALAAGYHMHVPKPIEPQELTTVVASLTGRLMGQ